MPSRALPGRCALRLPQESLRAIPAARAWHLKTAEPAAPDRPEIHSHSRTRFPMWGA
ncbi:hypothetical protein J4732_06985 [Serratia marcescens]|uniref:Uncharacterized protein n=1 Tax=Serratia marcescens TaxID=615 RepID=A0A939NKQ0_SERMA|nr:hypothetical protein [Serratia marcescens]